MKTSLNVIKADGGAEEYLHTKVIHTISNTLDAVNRPDVSIAESLADVVTYFLYNKKVGLAVPSNEVISVIKIALSATGYEDAAAALADETAALGQCVVVRHDAPAHVRAQGLL